MKKILVVFAVMISLFFSSMVNANGTWEIESLPSASGRVFYVNMVGHKSVPTINAGWANNIAELGHDDKALLRISGTCMEQYNEERYEFIWALETWIAMPVSQKTLDKIIARLNQLTALKPRLDYEVIFTSSDSDVRIYKNNWADAHHGIIEMPMDGQLNSLDLSSNGVPAGCWYMNGDSGIYTKAEKIGQLSEAPMADWLASQQEPIKDYGFWIGDKIIKVSLPVKSYGYNRHGLTQAAQGEQKVVNGVHNAILKAIAIVGIGAFPKECMFIHNPSVVRPQLTEKYHKKTVVVGNVIKHGQKMAELLASTAAK
jgi:hypothetical protein